MSEFLLMRHAKSDHPAGVSDRERPLSDRGRSDAATIGRALTDFDAAPTAIYTSPAVRARTTAEIAARSGGWDAPVTVVDRLYGGGIGDVFETLGADTGRVLVVGHEPTWSMAVAGLIGGGSIHMVTAAVACVECHGPPGPGRGWLRWMIHPRLLR